MITEAILVLIFIATCLMLWYFKRSDHNMQLLARNSEIAVLEGLKVKIQAGSMPGLAPKKTMEQFVEEAVPEPIQEPISDSQHVGVQTKDNPFERIGRSVEEI